MEPKSALPHEAVKTTSVEQSVSHKGHERHTHSMKKSDPFIDLPDDFNNTQAYPSDVHAGNAGPSPSLFADLVLAPVNMITFLLALAFVDRSQRQWRLSQHASESRSVWDRLSHWSLRGPEPYQGPSSTKWHNISDSDDRQPAGPGQRSGSSFDGWYARKKHRAMARLEIGDALDLRHRVLLILVAWTVLGGMALVWLFNFTSRMYGRLMA
nr:hypothetical protein B0A51_16354 [Rachicladosporium sp. CCFEE 5018]